MKKYLNNRINYENLDLSFSSKTGQFRLKRNFLQIISNFASAPCTIKIDIIKHYLSSIFTRILFLADY